ncbi:hypothetical protein [Streptomyces tubercidicus]|uniref:hypothetical protein n=1 Tax=Streptomyces tubercidicus TaxID=47759 RepID=UPI0036BED4E3
MNDWTAPAGALWPGAAATAKPGRRFASLAAEGIQLTDITDELETDGVARFQDSWQQLTADVRTTLHSTARTGGEPRAV